MQKLIQADNQSKPNEFWVFPSIDQNYDMITQWHNLFAESMLT